MELLESYDEAYKEAIAKHLLAQAKKSDAFRIKCQSSNKTLGGILSYCKSEAQKMCKGSVVMVDDATVYGWAIHYIEEDAINFEGGKCENPEAKKDKPKAEKSENKLAASLEKKKAKKPKQDDSLFGQLGLFA